jgi:hypothetical protein
MLRSLFPPNFREGALGAQLSLRILASVVVVMALWAHVWGSFMCAKAEKHFVHALGSTAKLPAVTRSVLSLTHSPWWEFVPYATLPCLAFVWVIRPAWMVALTCAVIVGLTMTFLCTSLLSFWIADLHIVEIIEENARTNGLLPK